LETGKLNEDEARNRNSLADFPFCLYDPSMIQIAPELTRLSLVEKLQVVEDLWDSIATNEEDIPIPDWQKAELAKRRENFLKNPQSGLSLEQTSAFVRKMDE
jgi:putative addiction module component (TIGR02574 family)